MSAPKNGGLRVLTVSSRRVESCPRKSFLASHYRRDGTCKCVQAIGERASSAARGVREAFANRDWVAARRAIAILHEESLALAKLVPRDQP